MQPELWIGTFEVYFMNPETPGVWKPAFTTVVTWACDSKEFSDKCNEIVENHGWRLIGTERAGPVSKDGEYSEEVEDMLDRAKDNPNAIILGTFHSYP
jgi:hypothetical protein